MPVLSLPEGLNVSYTAYKIGNDLMHDLTNGRETWKYPIKKYTTNDRELVVDIARIFDYYLGGSEIKTSVDTIYNEVYSVSSLGYYHYVGA